MSTVFYILTCLHTLCNCFDLHVTKTEELWHIYFYIMGVTVWRGDTVVYNCLIYFITDLFNSIILKNLKIFTIYHHTACCILIYLNRIGIMDNKIIELGVLQEISSIPLSLFHMGYISKPVYNILFSYSFIAVRLIYYNYSIYNAYLINGDIFNNITISFYILMNLTNIGIVWKMKLVQKLLGIRSDIECLYTKHNIEPKHKIN
jgi:hypothetical protein